MHTYANMQMNDIAGHYNKNSTVSKARQEAYHHKRDRHTDSHVATAIAA